MNRPKLVKIKKHCFCNTEEIVQPKTSKFKENKNRYYAIKTPIKKTLVRNTEKEIPEVRVVKDDLKEHNDRGIQTDTINRQTCTCKKIPSSFDIPKPHTLLQLSKKIESMGIKERAKNVKKIAAEEKILQNLNFPYAKPIYKDLIPLTCEKTESPPTSVRSPFPQKDIEPLLSDFVEIKKYPDYFVLLPAEVDHKILHTRNNNLRLYKILDLDS